MALLFRRDGRSFSMEASFSPGLRVLPGHRIWGSREEFILARMLRIRPMAEEGLSPLKDECFGSLVGFCAVRRQVG